MGQNDTVARLGGDEFAVIAQGSEDFPEHEESAIRLANRLISAIRQPMMTNVGWIEIDASLGIAFCRGDAVDSGHLLHAADIAMYRTK